MKLRTLFWFTAAGAAVFLIWRWKQQLDREVQQSPVIGNTSSVAKPAAPNTAATPGDHKPRSRPIPTTVRKGPPPPLPMTPPTVRVSEPAAPATPLAPEQPTTDEPSRLAGTATESTMTNGAEDETETATEAATETQTSPTSSSISELETESAQDEDDDQGAETVRR
ncbi:MAG: hypothetical protein HC837_19020 [Chloroflexaceae bacterium]|nr:hypothetical protein [Chloroflexaceae bacterium]